ncbi:hypothetical protein QAD02_009347 [Eretmocerus hayati]|uniref:Uncharacterized protein n=1 Tax=Eretmocerus hayati TaxID=131215 RepID=A0ACC2NBH4_9HYME|nr:hypothetical protein QAD02_009347 [Eretmocerus hayati]
MDFLKNSFFIIILFHTSLGSSITDDNDFIVQWTGPKNHEVIVIDIQRPDQGVFYIIYKKDDPKNELEFRLETPEFKKEYVVSIDNALYPYFTHSLGHHHAFIELINQTNKDNLYVAQLITVDMMKNETHRVHVYPDTLNKGKVQGGIYYENEFDLIVRNDSICIGIKKCRVSFDLNGRRIGEPVAFPLYPLLIPGGLPALKNSAKAGFFFNLHDPRSKTTRVLYVDEHARDISTFPSPKGDYYVSSNTHRLLSVCAVDYKDYQHKMIKCVQYDWEKYKLMNTSIEISQGSIGIAVTNLAGGGLIVSTAEFNYVDPYTYTTFNVMIIEPNGRFNSGSSYPLNIDCRNIKSQPGLISGISEVEDKFCFSFSCDHFWLEHKFKFYNRCIQKNSLSSLHRT